MNPYIYILTLEKILTQKWRHTPKVPTEAKTWTITWGIGNSYGVTSSMFWPISKNPNAAKEIFNSIKNKSKCFSLLILNK